MRFLRTIVVSLALAAAGVVVARAAEPLMVLQWAQLVPLETAKPKPKAFFNGATPTTPGYEPPPPQVESKWMSGAGRVNQSTAPVPVVQELNGKRVKIGGYVVPLDFEATKVTEFLLVPFVGACIHVPPPPANQIIYVKAEKGLTLKGEFDPVYVTGTLTTEGQFTGLAETGYSITAEAVDAK